jgi:hypothetical protein
VQWGVGRYLGAQCALINRDLAAPYATLFESLPISIAINSFITRGSALRHTPSAYSYARSLLTSQWLNFDSHLRDVLLDSVHKNFTSIVCVLMAIDKFSHECGPFSEATVRAYRSCDGIIAALVSLLKRIGKYEETLLLVTSDHGHSSTDHHFDICGALADMGYRVISHPLIRPRPDADAAVMISGNAFCQIYFRMGGLWNTPVDLDGLDHVVAQLLRHPAIDIVAGRRRDGWIGVLSRHGCAAIRMRGDDIEYIEYKALRGDPFGYPRMGASINAQAAWQATVADRDVSGTGQPVEFFGAPARLPTGAVLLGLRTGAPLVPVFAQRLRDARLFVSARPAVTLTHTRALRDDLQQGLHVLARLLEEGIARAPEQWVVFEPIWKDGAA